MIAAKNHKNGVGNPYAQMRKDLGYEFCRTESEKNPFVAGPLKRTDCSLVSDGAAALVLADVETALQLDKAVAFRAAAHVQDFLPMAQARHPQVRGLRASPGSARSRDAGIALGDLSFVETHDCFTIAELIEYEAMGLAPEGQGARAIKEGWTQKDGKLPVNPSGGLKAKGHPIGATGVSMHALCRHAAHRHGRRHAGARTPSSPASSTWAARRSRITSACWNGSNSRPTPQPICPPNCARRWDLVTVTSCNFIVRTQMNSRGGGVGPRRKTRKEKKNEKKKNKGGK